MIFACTCTGWLSLCAILDKKDKPICWARSCVTFSANMTTEQRQMETKSINFFI